MLMLMASLNIDAIHEYQCYIADAFPDADADGWFEYLSMS
jgi:hypothetical protein